MKLVDKTICLSDLPFVPDVALRISSSDSTITMPTWKQVTFIPMGLASWVKHRAQISSVTTLRAFALLVQLSRSQLAIGLHFNTRGATIWVHNRMSKQCILKLILRVQCKEKHLRIFMGN